MLTNSSLFLLLLALLSALVFWLFRERNRLQNEVNRLSSFQGDVSKVPLQTMIDSLPVGVVIYSPSKRLLMCNATFRDFYGYSEEEAKPGVTAVELGYIDLERSLISKIEEDNTPFIGRHDELQPGERGEEILELSNGRIVRSISQRLPEGELVRIQTDITNLKKTEKELEQSEELLRNAIESLDEGFIYYDKNDRLVIANSKYREFYPAQADMEPGVPFEDAIRRSIDQGEVPAAIGREQEWMDQRLLQHRENQPVKTQHLKDGRWVQVSERKTPDGGHVGIRTDITRLKQSLEMAESANIAKTAFLGHMSHELRTPLNAIIGFSSMMQQNIFGELGSPKYDEYAELINKSANLLLELITDLLDVSRIESENVEANIEELHPKEIVEECIDILRSTATHLTLTYENGLTVDHPNPVIEADPRHVRQIVINLITNALRYTPSGSVNVRIFLAETENGTGEVIITTTDTGIGIPDSVMDKIFEPFARVENAYVRTQQGTGLGLYLVKRLVEANDGIITLTSEEGIGTIATLRFPLQGKQD